MKRIRYFPNSLLSHSGPTRPQWVVTLLKRQQGRCGYCGLRVRVEKVLDAKAHHWDGDRLNNRYTNLGLLHAHCHDQVHGAGINDNDPRAEEPDEAKVSRPVLERQGGR